MPNGDSKNWIRFIITLESFYSLYGKWPSMISLYPFFIDELQEKLSSAEFQKLQSKMLRMQEELAERTVETSAGGGMVTVVANGRQQILSINIEQEVVDPEDVDMLQDLILAAVNDALTKSQEMVAAEMGKLTGGMNIPGLT